MIERRIQVEDGDRLTLTAMARDVKVAGWDEGDVLIRLQEGGEEDLTIEQTEDGPVVSARMPCEVYMPAALPLTIQQVSGNLRVTRLEASLDAEQIHGNLMLSDERLGFRLMEKFCYLLRERIQAAYGAMEKI